jgi:metal-responsive CopG/Arc/MetJ family transcriptional regulator
MDEAKSVKIPAGLYQAVEDKLKDSGFNSVSDFVIHATRKVLSEFERSYEVVNEEEKEIIRKRLKDLGYIE